MLDGERILLKRISDDDEGAFRVLFNYYYPKVLSFLGNYISSDEDCRDIAQNVFANIWKKRDTLAEIRSFGAWLYRLSRNGAIDYCRRKRITLSITEQYEDAGMTPADEEFVARESRLQYQRCLNNMPERRRQIFSLSREDGLSNAEIARQLGISKKTVENHMTAALREIRKTVS